MLPLTKGHLSNNDRTSWQKGGGILGREGLRHRDAVKKKFVRFLLVRIDPNNSPKEN